MVAGRISRSQNTHSKSAKRNTETWDGPLGIRCWPGKTHLCLLEVSSALGRQPHGTNCRLSRRLSTVTALRCTTWNPGATPPLCRSLGKDNFFFLGGKTLKALLFEHECPTTQKYQSWGLNWALPYRRGIPRGSQATSVWPTQTGPDWWFCPWI